MGKKEKFNFNINNKYKEIIKIRYIKYIQLQNY